MFGGGFWNFGLLPSRVFSQLSSGRVVGLTSSSSTVACFLFGQCREGGVGRHTPSAIRHPPYKYEGLGNRYSLKISFFLSLRVCRRLIAPFA